VKQSLNQECGWKGGDRVALGARREKRKNKKMTKKRTKKRTKKKDQASPSDGHLPS
jgi:hypothetical protein